MYNELHGIVDFRSSYLSFNSLYFFLSFKRYTLTFNIAYTLTYVYSINCLSIPALNVVDKIIKKLS